MDDGPPPNDRGSRNRRRRHARAFANGSMARVRPGHRPRSGSRATVGGPRRCIPFRTSGIPFGKRTAGTEDLQADSSARDHRPGWRKIGHPRPRTALPSGSRTLTASGLDVFLSTFVACTCIRSRAHPRSNPHVPRERAARVGCLPPAAAGDTPTSSSFARPWWVRIVFDGSCPSSCSMAVP